MKLVTSEVLAPFLLRLFKIYCKSSSDHARVKIVSVSYLQLVVTETIVQLCLVTLLQDIVSETQTLQLFLYFLINVPYLIL